MVWNLISTRCSAPMTTTPVPSTATARRCAIDTLPASDPLQWEVVSALSPSFPGAEGFASLMETTKPVYHGTVQNSATCPYVHGGIADGPCLNLCRTFRKVLLCESTSTTSSHMEWMWDPTDKYLAYLQGLRQPGCLPAEASRGPQPCTWRDPACVVCPNIHATKEENRMRFSAHCHASPAVSGLPAVSCP